MFTQGTNERGSNTNKSRNVRTQKDGYTGRRNEYGHRTEGTRGEGQEERFNRGDRPNNGNRYSKSGQSNGSARYGKNDNNRYGKSDYSDKNKGYNPRFAGKDEDEEDNSRRSKPSRPKESKSGVSIPDKNKTMLRLEKEQKTMLKKQQSKKKESSRPQPKQKRSNNVNYTKNYANGDYDDYEEYYEY